MSSLRLDRCLHFLAGIEPVVALLWLGLAVFTVAVAILMYSRWGQSTFAEVHGAVAPGPCLAGRLCHDDSNHYSRSSIASGADVPRVAPRHRTFRRWARQAAGGGAAGPAAANANQRPWETFPNDAVAQPAEPNLDRGKTDLRVEPKRWVRAKTPHSPAKRILSTSRSWK